MGTLVVKDGWKFSCEKTPNGGYSVDRQPILSDHPKMIPNINQISEFGI